MALQPQLLTIIDDLPVATVPITNIYALHIAYVELPQQPFHYHLVYKGTRTYFLAHNGSLGVETPKQSRHWILIAIQRMVALY